MMKSQQIPERPTNSRCRLKKQMAILVSVLALNACDIQETDSTDTQSRLNSDAPIVVLNSSPEPGAVLTEAPQTVRVWFEQTPQPTAAGLVIEGEETKYEVSHVHSMGENDLMGMVLTAIPDGNYVLSWRHGSHEGEIPFALQRADDLVEDKWEAPLDIGVVLYDGAEPLDVFGPLEMWMNAGPENVRVHLIAEEKRPIVLTTTSYPRADAPMLLAQYDFDSAPELDVLMVPGGIGTLVEVDNPRMIDYLQRTVRAVAVATSVCTGSALLAKAGVLDGVRATGNKVFFDYIANQGPADWQIEARWVESGRFFTSSGVSAGIDMSLAVIERFFGIDAARMIAASTEYEWNEDPEHDPFAHYANSATQYVGALRERFLAQ